ncbi:MAG TPA: aquaporin, partial [Rubrobacter sp.]|nr:aquaporin [Rubrobacter sp.]
MLKVLDAVDRGMARKGVAHTREALDEAIPDALSSVRSGMVFALRLRVTGSILMNTAVSGTWTGHWAYWIGPIAGAVLGALLYRYVRAADPPTVAGKNTLVPDSLPRTTSENPKGELRRNGKCGCSS